MKNALYLACGLLLSLAASAGNTPASDAAAATATLHLDWMDTKANPARDFFQYSNGSWVAANPIPAEYSGWGVDQLLTRQNEDFIHGLLESAAADSGAAAGSERRKIGDFYASGMDEDAIEKAGIAPLQPEFERIASLRHAAEFGAELAHLQLIGVDAAFNVGQMQDFKDSTQVIGVVMQAGLGLPERDYYLKQDAKFAGIRKAYTAHLQRLFVLLGDKPEQATAEARTVLAFETRLARASMPAEALRDPHAIYHPMDRAALAAAAPALDWAGYFAELGHPELQSINLATPGFFKALSKQLRQTPIADWRVYLRLRTA